MYQGRRSCWKTYITGRYPHRLAIGLDEPLNDANMEIGIPEDHPTIASLIKGKRLRNRTDHGFDEFFGINGSAPDYFTRNNAAGRFGRHSETNASE